MSQMKRDKGVGVLICTISGPGRIFRNRVLKPSWKSSQRKPQFKPYELTKRTKPQSPKNANVCDS